MKKKVDFIIRYEHKVRELESIVLIKLELERRGYSVHLVCNFEYEDDDNYQPKVFVAPAVYSNGQLYGDLYKYGLLRKIANLQWEQLIGKKEEDDENGFHNIKEIGQKVLNFCWGERSQTRIVQGGCDELKSPVVGMINTDLLRGPFKSSLFSKKELSEKYKIDEKKNWYLFISSFAFCEMDEHQAQLAKAQFGLEDFNIFTEQSYKSREIIFDWFEKILPICQDTIIIYRPHPDETEKYNRLRLFEEKYPNFKVVSSEAIKHWINASDKVYNWYSTGVIDALVLEKPVRMLRPVEIKEDLDYRLMHTAVRIEKEEEFIKDFNNIGVCEIFEKNILNSYYYMPQGYVYKSICDYLETLLNSEQYDIKYSIKEKFNLSFILVRRRIFNCMMRFLSFVPDSFWPGFIRKRIVIHRELLQMRKNGFDRNYASEQEIEVLTNRFKTIIYGQ